MTNENYQHHEIAHEKFYIRRRLKYLDIAEAVAAANDPLAWEALQDEYADVCSEEAFCRVLHERCGYRLTAHPLGNVGAVQ
jgi:hypothetical protein